MNAYSGIITAAFKKNWENLINEVIRAYANTATLYFISSEAQECNCANVPANISPNPYVGGAGPAKYNPNCVLCGGSGKYFPETSKSLELAIVPNTTKWVQIAGNTYTPLENRVQVVCSIAHLGDLKSCSYIIFNSNLSQYQKDKYIRDSNPEIYGFDQTHLISYWKPA